MRTYNTIKYPKMTRGNQLTGEKPQHTKFGQISTNLLTPTQRHIPKNMIRTGTGNGTAYITSGDSEEYHLK